MVATARTASCSCSTRVDPAIVDATMSVVADSCATVGATAADEALVAEWLEHRNDTSALQELTRKGFVVDTMEIAAPWSRIDDVFERTRSALLAVPHAVAATCHLSHSYLDGACLYFTFAATPPPDEIESTYVALWDAGQRTVLASGGNLSHHHGIGINRARFVAEALGPAHGVLVAMKARARSQRHPQPRQARAALTVRPGAVAVNPQRWDVPALKAGGMVALVFAVPFSIGSRWAADRDDSTLATFLVIGAVLGFVLGAGCAAWVQRVGLPLSHGIVTAVGTYVVAQAVFVAIRLVRGSEVRWFALLFNLSVTVGAGLVGGILGERLRAKGFRPSSMQDAP